MRSFRWVDRFTVHSGFLALAAGFLTLTGCGDPPELEIGPVGFQDEELGVLGPSQRRTLSELTAFGLVISEDRISELIGPYVRADLRSIVRQRMAMEMSLNEAGIGDDVLRSAYQGNPQQEITVRHLVVISEDWRPPQHRDSARARAREALERIRAGADFEAVVAEYSDEALAAERGGLLRPGRRDTWTPPFWDAASSLQVGEISDVVETEFGYHVIRLEDRQDVPFEEARIDVLERFVDLEQSLQRASDWISEVQAVMAVDTPAILRWRQEIPPDPTVLIRWPDSLGVPDYTMADLLEHVESFRPETVAAVRQLDSMETVGFVEHTSRTHIVLDRAADQGIAATEAQRVAIHRRWEEQVALWGDALGFRRDMSTGAIKAQAFRALGSPLQSMVQARTSVARMGTRLEQLYPVRRAPSEDG